MRRLVPLVLAAGLLAGCSGSGAPSAAPSAAPSPSPTRDASEIALSRTPPIPSFPDTVEDDQLAGGPYSSAQGQAAYLAALRVLELLRQNRELLTSAPKTRDSFAEVLAVSTPEHRAFLEERVTAFLQAQEDPADTAAAEKGDELRGAMTISLRPAELADGEGGPAASPGPGTVRFASYDPQRGAYGVLSVARTAVYDYEPPEGGTALAVAFDVFAPYNVLDDAGEAQVATVMVTDFRMVMAEDRGEWLWDGWDLEDVSVSLVPQP